jgi:antitoxin ParD1/3/4
MGTMNISLPDELRSFVDEQVATRGYGSTSEYLRDLIRRERDREHLRTLLLEGANSPQTGIADRAYFDKLRKQVRRRRSA